MNALTVTTTVKTRKAETEKEATVTNLTLDFTGMTPEELAALAANNTSLVVRVQSVWRKDGIPAGDYTLNVKDFLARERAPRAKLSLAEQLAKLSPEERASLLAQFAG